MNINDIEISFLKFGGSRDFINNWIHRKQVPEEIIACVLHGKYEISCSLGRASIEEGEAFLVPPDIPLEIKHIYGKKGYMEACWAHFRYTVAGHVDVCSLLEMPLKVNKAKSSEIIRIIQEFRYEFHENGNILFEEARKKELGYKLLSCICKVSRQNNEKLLFSNDERFLKIEKFVKEKSFSGINVKKIASLAGISPPRLYSLFSEKLGMSPMDFVKKRKMTEAARLLLSTELRLYEISERLGFANQFHLSRIFKEILKETPRDYRKNHKSMLV